MKAIKFKSKDWLTYLPTISYHQCDLVLQSGSTKLHLPLVLAAAASPRLANLLQDQQDKEQACVIISDYCQHTLAALSDLLTTGGTYSLNLRHMVELEEICTLLGFGRFPRRQRGAVKKIVDVAAPAQAAPKTLDAEVSSNNLNQVETVAKIAFPSTGPSPSSPISTSLQQKEVPFLNPVISTLGTENHKEAENSSQEMTGDSLPDAELIANTPHKIKPQASVPVPLGFMSSQSPTLNPLQHETSFSGQETGGQKEPVPSPGPVGQSADPATRHELTTTHRTGQLNTIFSTLQIDQFEVPVILPAVSQSTYSKNQPPIPTTQALATPVEQTQVYEEERYEDYCQRGIVEQIAMEAEGNKEHMQKLRECILKEDEKKTYRDSRDPSVS